MNLKLCLVLNHLICKTKHSKNYFLVDLFIKKFIYFIFIMGLMGGFGDFENADNESLEIFTKQH